MNGPLCYVTKHITFVKKMWSILVTLVGRYVMFGFCTNYVTCFQQGIWRTIHFMVQIESGWYYITSIVKTFLSSLFTKNKLKIHKIFWNDFWKHHMLTNIISLRSVIKESWNQINIYELISVCSCPGNMQMISDTAYSSQTKLIGQSLHVWEHGIG